MIPLYENLAELLWQLFVTFRGNVFGHGLFQMVDESQGIRGEPVFQLTVVAEFHKEATKKIRTDIVVALQFYAPCIRFFFVKSVWSSTMNFPSERSSS